jgi:hypothetical protein
MLDGLSLILAQTAASPIESLDWTEILSRGGSVPLIVWMAYEIIHLRKENDRLNQETRDMAKSSVEALVRMASERKS